MNLFNAPLFSKKGLTGALVALFLVVGLLVTIYQVKKQQEIRQRAAAPTAVCPVPNGTTCSWSAVSAPSGYSVSYTVQVKDSTGNNVPVSQNPTTGTSVTFT